MAFVPSKYQEAIFQFAQFGRGDLFCEAAAGSGKTTTLEQLALLLAGFDFLFLAFNKDIVTELKNRLGEKFPCSTLNSLGHQALMKHLGKRKLILQGDKYGNLLFQALKDMGIPKESFAETLRITKQLVSFAMSNLADGDDDSLSNLVDYYGIEMPSKLSDTDTFNLVRSVMHTGEAMGRQGIISFDDQIWLPVKWNLVDSIPKAQIVAVDEAQDLSKAKLELVLMARAPGGRMFFVGDRHQSIYGFAGADARAVPNIIERTQATVLPLSISYRCPKKIIEHAQKVVPTIEAAENAIEGIHEWVSEVQAMNQIKTGDLILCRTTAPLISLCIQLIKNRIPARVKGREVGKQLVNVAKEALRGRDWSELETALDEYYQDLSETLRKRKNSESALQLLQDKVEGVRACVEGLNVKSLDQFAKEVENIFSDGNALVNLSTIHRAKGLEADTVYILAPSKLPLRWKGQRDWELEQENNLDYVARTRSKRALYYIREKDKAA